MDKNDIGVIKDILSRVNNKASITYIEGGANEYDENGDFIINSNITQKIEFKCSSKMLSILELEKMSLKNISYRIQFYRGGKDISDNIKGAVFKFDNIDDNDTYTVKSVDKMGYYGGVVLYSIIVEKR